MLNIKTIWTTYGKKIKALQGVSLSVKTGEIVSLIGANGAGKSTLLKTICGILTSEAGEIHFMGKNISGLAAWEITRLGISHVPEGRHIFPKLTVLENLEMGAYFRREDHRKNLERVFELFPVLKERPQQLGGTLSGGEQQMLAISRALMATPKLLMLDEPSMGLSPILVERIFETIREINRSGTTILLVEQNAEKALQLASRAYVLESGTLVLEGPASDLLAHPRVQEAYLGIVTK